VTALQRYVLYQVPGVAFVGIAAASAWAAEAVSGPLAVGLVALWVAKDVALYPLVRRSYARGETPGEQLLGTEAEVRVALDPLGWVWARGELWRAEVRPGAPSLAVGRRVVIRGLDGLVLVVEPAKSVKGVASS